MRPIVLLALIACGSSQPKPKTSATASRLSTAAPSCDPVDYGATPNDETDDRAAIQAALDQCPGRRVTLPAGTFYVGEVPPRHYYGVRVNAGGHLSGAGREATVLKQMPNLGGSVRLVQMVGDDTTISDLTLDGNKANQTINEHRHGVMVVSGNRVVIRDVKAQNFTGDGFYLWRDQKYVLVDRVYALGNDRNGLTMGATSSHITITSSYFLGNRAQQVDSEPGPLNSPNVVTQVKLVGCTLDALGANPSGNGYVLTISGTGPTTTPGSGWTVVGNTLNGPVLAVWVEGVVVANNNQANPTERPCFTAARRSRDVLYEGNHCEMTQQTKPGQAAIYAYGTTSTDSPRVTIRGNVVDLTAAHPDSMGVMVNGVESAVVEGNLLRGPAQPSTAFAASGVYVRAAHTDVEAMKLVVVRNNRIGGFAKYGISQWGNKAADGASARITMLDVTGNIFDDQKTGVLIDGDKFGAVRTVISTGNQSVVAPAPIGKRRR